MMPPRLELAVGFKQLPSSTPHLLPFHIKYSGPAPISTYFHISEAKNRVAVPLLSADSVEAKHDCSEAGAITNVVVETKVDSLGVGESSQNEGSTSTDASQLDETRPDLAGLTKRFVSSFRGRTIHGLDVKLPEGYAGVIFKSVDGDGQDTNITRSKGKGVAVCEGMHSKTKQAEEDVEDMSMDDDGESRDRPTRTLNPESTFSSFVVWHPDYMVDEGRDEYIRSLSEWTSLAAVIHQVDD